MRCTRGGGLFAWAKLSANLEPIAIQRKIIGFDTFSGFPSINKKDTRGKIEKPKLMKGEFEENYNIFNELKECIKEYDNNRFLNQYNKIELVKGDATVTIPKFIKDNPHIIISLLFLDFDLYEPTKAAIDYLVPRMPKGGVLVFDEINNESWPGETVAMLEKFKISNYKISRFNFDPNISYIVL